MSRLSRLAAVFAIVLAIRGQAQNTCPHPTPTLVSPADKATDVPSFPVIFNWSAVTGALGYEVWASADGGVFMIVGGTSDTTLYADLDPGTKIEWYVVTNFADCKTESAHATFTAFNCGARPAVLVSPPDGQANTSSPVLFQWTAPDGALGYRVWFAKAGEDYDVLGEPNANSFTANLGPGSYSWFVESFFDNCAETYSGLGYFTIPRNVNCGATPPVLMAPANGAQVASPITFTWNAVPSAVGYELWVALDDGDFGLLDETTIETSSLQDIGVGHVSWYVVAQFNGCDSSASQTGEFDVPFDPACDHDAPLLISPADGDRDVPLSVDFLWTPVADAVKYRVWIGYGGANPQPAGETTQARLTLQVAEGEISWFVETMFATCGSNFSPASNFMAARSAVCRLPVRPDIFVDPEAISGNSYFIIWSPGLNTASYELQEATKENFSDGVTKSLTSVITEITHTVSTPTRYFYRIRSLSSCNLGFGPYSDAASVVVVPSTTSSDNANAVTSFGTQSNVVQTIHIPGNASASGKAALANQGFTATADKPWLTVTPSSGTIPPEGIDLVVTADPKTLPVGSSSATIHLNTTTSATSPSVPINVNLVTPITPTPGNSPIPNSLIIPAIAHANGVGTTFESDVRIANASAQTMRYQLNFTPSGADGTKVGLQSTIQVGPGETSALNDILRNFYGYAAQGDSIAGTLEIRPLANGNNNAPPSVTFASSRTFAATSNGTYGQYIPAIPFSKFIGKAAGSNGKTPTISLQQIAQSAAYRTNLGLVEGSGNAVTALVNIFGDNGGLLTSFTVDLKPGEQTQLGNVLAAHGLSNITDGRIEVSVANGTGKISAYASVLDNRTNDPMLILPVNVNNVSATRYILPGIADLNNTLASWRSDVRLFNGGDTPATVQLRYYAQGDSAGRDAGTFTIQPGEVKAIDSALQTLLALQNSGGSLVVTTPANSKLVATARTYNQTGNGTYGQFIPGVTVADGVGKGDRALQILQVEESDRYRTNLGIVELSGNPVTVEIITVTPDSKVAAKTTITLQANEFRQIGSIIKNLGLGPTYNARIAIKVVDGTGKITGYASLIDNVTQDPTYVPAQ